MKLCKNTLIYQKFKCDSLSNFQVMLGVQSQKKKPRFARFFVPICNFPFCQRFAMTAAVPDPQGDRSKIAGNLPFFAGPALMTTVFLPCNTPSFSLSSFFL